MYIKANHTTLTADTNRMPAPHDLACRPLMPIPPRMDRPDAPRAICDQTDAFFSESAQLFEHRCATTSSSDRFTLPNRSDDAWPAILYADIEITILEKRRFLDTASSPLTSMCR